MMAPLLFFPFMAQWLAEPWLAQYLTEKICFSIRHRAHNSD